MNQEQLAPLSLHGQKLNQRFPQVTLSYSGRERTLIQKLPEPAAVRLAMSIVCHLKKAVHQEN
jgi:hypothetical protein